MYIGILPTVIIVMLGFMIVLSALVADRSARRHRPLRAMFLNLLGIGCLVLGLVWIFSWSQARSIDRTRSWAMAGPRGAPAQLARLARASDGRLVRPLHDSQGPENPEAEQGDVAEDPATLVELGDAPEPDSPEQLVPEEAWTPEFSQVEIDFDARPEWVEQPSRNLGAIHQIAVSSGPYTTQRTARRELYRKLKKATDQYINDVVGSSKAAHWVGYDEESVRYRFVAAGNFFDEKIISPSVGLMRQSHALLEFGPAFHHEVEQAWHQVQARAQLVKVALAGGAVLGMLLLLFGYFQTDTATRGFYSGRLKFVTALAILALVATGFWVAHAIPWLWL